MTVVLTDAVMRTIAAHVEATYPEEGCGVVIADSTGALEVRALTNAYNRYHQLDPTHYPRNNRTAYLFEPKAWLKVMDELDATGKTVGCIFHSHADVGAYFSKEDQTQAIADGQPLMPGVPYLVVAVNHGKALEGRLFEFRADRFEETKNTSINALT